MRELGKVALLLGDTKRRSVETANYSYRIRRRQSWFGGSGMWEHIEH